MIAIILLNWNGWEDTVECVKSILEVNDVEYSIIIVDNGSTNDSVSKISGFLHSKGVCLYTIQEGESITFPIKKRDVIMYQLNTNYGFAKGNNLGIKLLTNQNIDYFWILNNDTIIEKNSIKILKSFMDSNSDYKACTPQIRYYSHRNTIWNCGGKLIWGFRKYYYELKENVIFDRDFFDITFVTGCALFVRKELINDKGNLFTERFFFGEEDFDFCLRMKEQKNKMACHVKSLIYHKVNTATKNKPKLASAYGYYLNRYIDIRNHFSKVEFFLWRHINNLYIVFFLLRNGFGLPIIGVFIKTLNKECFIYNEVTKKMFENIKEEFRQ